MLQGWRKLRRNCKLASVNKDDLFYYKKECGNVRVKMMIGEALDASEAIFRQSSLGLLSSSYSFIYYFFFVYS